MSSGRECEGRVTTPAGRPGQSQAASTFRTASNTSSGKGSSGAPSASIRRKRLPQPMSVSRPTARPGSAATSAGIRPEASTPSAAIPVGHIRRGVTSTPGRRSRSAGVVLGAAVISVGRGPPGAVVAPAARRRLRVVEFAAQVLHPAAVGLCVPEHRLLLAGPLGGDSIVSLLVVDPRLAGHRPATGYPADRAVHVQDLQHHLQPAAGQVHVGFQGRERLRAVRAGQRGQGHPHVPLRREGEAGEVGPDVPVLGGQAAG